MADARINIIAPLQIKNNPDGIVAFGKNIDFTNFDWQEAGARGSFTFTANVNVGSNTDVNLTDLAIPDGIVPKVNDLVLDINGDLYLVTAVADGTIHVSDALTVNLKGPVGAKGDKGDVGSVGPQGPTGAKGEKGDPFTIAKTFPSVKAMNDGFATDDVATGSFVMIDTGNVEDADNAKLYVKGDEAYTFVTDLSGATGLTGPQGEAGPQGIQGPKGEAGPAGAKGDPGAAGAKGDPGAAGPKGDTGARGSFTFTAKVNVSSDSDVSLTDLNVPTGVTPAVNDYILDINGDLYLITALKDGAVSVGNALSVNLKGPQGDGANIQFVSDDFIDSLFE